MSKKVRSAWISFVGRVVAQIVGAVASVVLGLAVLHKYSEKEHPVAVAAPAVTEQVRPVRADGALVVAVLPLQDYSPGATQTSLADGVTEALIADLAQIDGLRVTSRTSSMAYKTTGKTLPAIARELGADLVLECSLVRDAARVRITAQLIDAATDVHLWARSYDRPAGEAVALHASLADAVARGVSGALGPRLVRNESPVRSSAPRAAAPVSLTDGF